MIEQFRETGVLTDAIRDGLRDFRKMHGLSKYALGNLLGVEAITIGRWERGETRVVHLCQREMISDLLEGRLDVRIVCRHDCPEVVPKSELSQLLWNVCEVYSVCNTPEKRQKLFQMLDGLENKLRNKVSKKH